MGIMDLWRLFKQNLKVRWKEYRDPNRYALLPQKLPKIRPKP